MTIQQAFICKLCMLQAFKVNWVHSAHKILNLSYYSMTKTQIRWSFKFPGSCLVCALFLSLSLFQFAPDLVLISAGFDAAIGDPLVGTTQSIQRSKDVILINWELHALVLTIFNEGAYLTFKSIFDKTCKTLEKWDIQIQITMLQYMPL